MLGWDVTDMIDSIIRDSAIKMKDKKTQVMSIMDDYEQEVGKILAGKKSIVRKDNEIDETITDNNIMEEDMDFTKITLEELKKERPDLVSAVESNIENTNKSKELEKDHADMKERIEKIVPENEKLKEDLESVTKERDDLKKKVDEQEVIEKKAQKEAFIADKIKDMKVPEDAISDVFKEDLMGKDDDGIIKALEDRKELWTKGKGVHNAGTEYNASADEGEVEVTKEKKEEAKANFKSVLS